VEFSNLLQPGAAPHLLEALFADISDNHFRVPIETAERHIAIVFDIQLSPEIPARIEFVVLDRIRTEEGARLLRVARATPALNLAKGQLGGSTCP
jgi:hypothetical protein